MTTTTTDQARAALGVNVIRALAMDSVQKAGNGHPGTAMALAPLAHVLWTRVMSYDAARPDWPDRDRFVLSPGHASILLYSMLHLTGFGLELDDLKAFRTYGSKTPGHPERGHTVGVEVTTGPLGQGIGNAVGMAITEANLRARFGEDLCSHYTYAIVGDGDLMEGVSHEAASLAGHLGLGRLICIYDDNHITIDGPTELALTDDAAMRFRSYGWHVDEVGEIANDLDALEAAIERAKAVTDRPSFIRLRSHIAYPAPTKMDTSSAHGSPLGADEVAKTKEILGLPATDFFVPDDVLAMYRAAGSAGRAAAEAWDARIAAHPGGEDYLALVEGRFTPTWADALPTYAVGTKVATRVASGDCANALLSTVPSLIGGGADLTGNTGTMLKNVGVFSAASPEGRLVHFGVREHGMGAVMNGMAAHGGALPVGGTFFVFSDYMRGAVRVAAISGLHVIYSWTHDSLGVGEDGPTHQPIEQLASLRAMPGLRLIRPADGNETAAAWRVAVASTGPTALVLSRQDLPVLEGSAELAEQGVARGAYVLSTTANGDELPDVVLVGTGSEVQHCVAAATALQAEGYTAQVVSMPSWDLFDEQDEDYLDEVFPDGVPVVACEAGASLGWERWADLSITVDTWGASGAATKLMEEYGFTADAVTEAALLLIEGVGE
jgi:transketolase